MTGAVVPDHRPNSRKGQRIASVACDLCRKRKTQCKFDPNSPNCRRCVKAGLSCTFLRNQQSRGRPSRYLIDARKRHIEKQFEPTSPQALSPGVPSGPQFPVIRPSIEDLCPLQVWDTIICDFFDLLYPVIPFIHRATFQQAYDSREYETNPMCFRICLSLAAATIASMPRRLSIYGANRFSTTNEMVHRASTMVLRSRIDTQPVGSDNPTLEACLTSFLLSLASCYAGQNTTGRVFANEAALFFRTLRLYNKKSHETLNPIESEMAKRLFWILYIGEIHDRLNSLVPYSTFCFEPIDTDWEFLAPQEIDDDPRSMSPQIDETSRSTSSIPTSSPPLILGFISLIKVYLCVADILSTDFPRAPLSVFLKLPRSLEFPFLGPSSSPDLYVPPLASPPSNTLTLASIKQLEKRLEFTIRGLPSNLQLHPPSRVWVASPSTKETLSFEIMRVNIHITNIFAQSSILETYSSINPRRTTAFRLDKSYDTSLCKDGKVTDATSIWMFCERLAIETLDILQNFSQKALEANGASLIIKVRQIAAALLECADHLPLPTTDKQRLQNYIQDFAHALAALDHISQDQIQPTVGGQ